MKSKERNPTKEHYQRLRVLSCEELWREEVPRFDQASPRDRMAQVSVVRAVGVVFSESGTDEQKSAARAWLRGLLDDPEEKIRRYAMVALPKIGADQGEEAQILSLLKKPASEREKKFVGQTLEKIGGSATLAAPGLSARTKQKVQGAVARATQSTSIRLDAEFDGTPRLHLHTRIGLEDITAEEVEAGGVFDVVRRAKTLIAIEPKAPFRLSDVFFLRCFSSMGFVLGTAPSGSDETEAIARVITSPLSRRILETFTDGPIRYRLEFASKGHQRAAVKRLADRVYALEPAFINDSHAAPWAINIYHLPQGCSVELSPRLSPDPRFAYRRRDIPAASHPPLAASMARLIGPLRDEIVWDPFCGSGLELIETVLRGGVQRVIGTDLDPEALDITRENLAAAEAPSVGTNFLCGDFRDLARSVGTVSVIISNPPMGRRVPVRDLGELIEDLFTTASTSLRRGGRLVFANPLPIRPRSRTLRLELRQRVDLGGFHCHVEKYVKVSDR